MSTSGLNILPVVTASQQCCLQASIAHRHCGMALEKLILVSQLPFCYCAKSHHTVEERVFLVMKGSQGGKSGQEPKQETMEESSLLAGSPCSLLVPPA